MAAPPNSCGGPGGAPAQSPAALHCVALGGSLTSFCPFSHLQNGDQMHLSHKVIMKVTGYTLKTAPSTSQALSKY